MANIFINKKIITVDDYSESNRVSYAQLVTELVSIGYEEWYSSIGGDTARDYHVERGPFAPFVDVFYQLFCNKQKVPTPQEVCETYDALYCIDLGNGMCRLANGFTFPRYALYGRITRAYCSWCRELSLLYSLFEVLPSDFKVFYDMKMDKHGVDIVVIHNGYQHNIHSYLRSRKSMIYRAEKNSRYAAELGNHIDVIASEFNTRRVGDIDVHGHENAAWLLNQMYAYENVMNKA